MINDENKKSIKKMLKSNALYLALGLCLLGAGVVGISAANSVTPSTVSENTTVKQENISIEEKNTEKDVSDFKVEINIDEFTTSEAPEPSTAAVFDNNAEKLSEEETTEEKTEIVFSSPLGSTIGKDYSMGIPVFSETMKDYRTHNGVDFLGIKGENVKTVAPGTVISVKHDAVYGNTVTVDHGSGITSSISGLADEALVTVGTTLYSDTIIGVVGTVPVESSDESHVHLEMRINGELTDPLEMMGLSGE